MTPNMVDVLFVGGVVGVDPKISVLGGGWFGFSTFIATGATITNILFSFKHKNLSDFTISKTKDSKRMFTATSSFHDFVYQTVYF